MALSKSRRMQILLAINGLFFIIELAVGIWVHSLALVADSFHMLNDVLSLCVGIWAVNVASSKSRSKVYTYGWQRAETLGALVNGVFLVALCFSIILEAIQRFFDVPEISNPKWILGVGSAGLSMNILGLFLFHDHDHGHSHSEESTKARKHRANPQRASEEGAVSRSIDRGTIADDSGNAEDAVPEIRIKSIQIPVNRTRGGRSGESDSTLVPPNMSSSAPRISSSQGHRRKRSRTYSTINDIAVHPASIRNGIIAASRLEDLASEPTTDTEDDANDNSVTTVIRATERDPLLGPPTGTSAPGRNGRVHVNHKHANPSSKGGHGHGHDLNMRAVFLHVLGDALGNIGVIGTALFIWLTPYKWRFYADPVISLVITVIILASALPLCRAASRILLQAVPTGLNVDDIKADILSLPGIIGCHHLHVWQLSDTKLVASLHVRVSLDIKGELSEEYMELARQIRKCLHGYGIHSSTIQPEFWCQDPVRKRGKATDLPREPSTEDDSCSQEDTGSEINRKSGISDAGCLLDCDEECGDGGKCCLPASSPGGQE